MIIEFCTNKTSNPIDRVDVGKVYILHLPLEISHPCLSFNTLIAHKNLPGHSKGWTVTHLKSGRRIAGANTKKSAIDNTRWLLKGYSNDELNEIFESSTQHLESVKSQLAYGGTP